jgi:hypothetical protein
MSAALASVLKIVARVFTTYLLRLLEFLDRAKTLWPGGQVLKFIRISHCCDRLPFTGGKPIATNET